MEKIQGRCVFRTRHAEEKAKRIYEDLKRNKMEELYKRIQENFDQQTSVKGIISELFSYLMFF